MVAARLLGVNNPMASRATRAPGFGLRNSLNGIATLLMGGWFASIPGSDPIRVVVWSHKRRPCPPGTA
jgi:hypothetical protein